MAVERLNKAKFGYFKSESFIIDRLKEANLYIDGVRCAVAYVVEAADVISMVISDFEDGVKKGCINIRNVERYLKDYETVFLMIIW